MLDSGKEESRLEAGDVDEGGSSQAESALGPSFGGTYSVHSEEMHTPYNKCQFNAFPGPFILTK